MWDVRTWMMRRRTERRERREYIENGERGAVVTAGRT